MLKPIIERAYELAKSGQFKHVAAKARYLASARLDQPLNLHIITDSEARYAPEGRRCAQLGGN